MIYSIGERKVDMRGDNIFIAPNAIVIGSVTLKNNVGIWWSAVVRADIGDIHIGENSNVQDLAILHTDEGIHVVIGRNVTVAHRAVLHGCRVGDNSLIGIGAIVLNRAVI
jgi:carbonic anhydrase/acetyltransferase-like protein (isoleucine patch superfamily)